MDQRITMSIVFGKSVKPGTRWSVQPPAIGAGTLQLLPKRPGRSTRKARKSAAFASTLVGDRGLKPF
jgi:hypothetical protein